jgi:hypothetical protein
MLTATPVTNTISRVSQKARGPSRNCPIQGSQANKAARKAGITGNGHYGKAGNAVRIPAIRGPRGRRSPMFASSGSSKKLAHVYAMVMKKTMGSDGNLGR